MNEKNENFDAEKEANFDAKKEANFHEKKEAEKKEANFHEKKNANFDGNCVLAIKPDSIEFYENNEVLTRKYTIKEVVIEGIKEKNMVFLEIEGGKLVVKCERCEEIEFLIRKYKEIG